MLRPREEGKIITLCVHREGESWGALVANQRMIQLPDGSLQISNASLNDSGQYTCTVNNSKITITAELDVLSAYFIFSIIYLYFHAANKLMSNKIQSNNFHLNVFWTTHYILHIFIIIIIIITSFF